MTDRETDTQKDAHQALIDKAKQLGIRNPHVCKPETLQQKIAQALSEPDASKGVKEVAVSIGDFGKEYLKSIGFDFDWFGPLAAQYNIDKFEYLHKFRAFRAYSGGKHVDWVSINDFAILNGKRELCEIQLKNQNVNKERAVFKFHWRVR